ncbi:MAG: glutamine synthetase beta-grasp domain-containing protein, partial [Candidatus Bathyarchaeia archaeon]
MDAENVKKAIELLKEQKVRWVHSAFIDIRGLLQDMIVPARDYIEGSAFTSGVGFDGSSVRGFKAIDESDMTYMPDPETLAIVPWTNGEDQKSAIILGDVHEAYGGGPSEVCPRGYVAKRAEKTAEGLGYTAYVAPELEYFLFSSVDPTKLVWDLWVSPKGGEGDSWGPPRVVPQ